MPYEDLSSGCRMIARATVIEVINLSLEFNGKFEEAAASKNRIEWSLSNRFVRCLANVVLFNVREHAEKHKEAFRVNKIRAIAFHGLFFI